jgi:hypothetical protein
MGAPSVIKWCVRPGLGRSGRGGHTNSFFDLTISDNTKQASKKEREKEGRKEEVENR